MGEVYLAEHLRLGRKVAIKVLSPTLADDEGFRDRFLRESKHAAALDHPNIVPIDEAGEAGGSLFGMTERTGPQAASRPGAGSRAPSNASPHSSLEEVVHPGRWPAERRRQHRRHLPIQQPERRRVPRREEAAI